MSKVQGRRDALNWAWIEEGTGFRFLDQHGDRPSILVLDEEGDPYATFDSDAITYEPFVAECVEYVGDEFNSRLGEVRI